LSEYLRLFSKTLGKIGCIFFSWDRWRTFLPVRTSPVFFFALKWRGVKGDLGKLFDLPFTGPLISCIKETQNVFLRRCFERDQPLFFFPDRGTDNEELFPSWNRRICRPHKNKPRSGTFCFRFSFHKRTFPRAFIRVSPT